MTASCLKELKKKGRELAQMDEAELRSLPQVAAAFSDARDQVRRYGEALVERFGAGTIRLRSYVVVAVGLERLLGEEVASAAVRTDP
jgi:hypothetical protein